MLQLKSLSNANSMGQHLRRISFLRSEVNMLLHRAEVHWRQRSRMVWLAVRDKNTKFFHQQAIQCRRTNKIEGSSNSNGQWCTDGFEIGNIAIQYFEDIFGSSYPHRMDETLSIVPPVVSEGMNHQLSVPYLAEEVRQALFDMPPSKALGPDGMLSFFFFFPKILACGWL